MIQTLNLPRPERRSIDAPVLNPGAWEVFRAGSGTEAGVSISDGVAMQISTVFACIRILAESVASLPLRLYKTTERGRTPETSSPLYRLLQVAPNDEQTSFSLIETLVAHLALTGNGFVQIERNASGLPIALWNLQPRQTEPFRQTDGSLGYRTTDGESAGKSRVIASKDMLHVPLTTWDGCTGLSPIMQAKRTLGVSIAAEQYGARFFSGSAVPQLVMKTADKIKPEDKARMRDDWQAMQSGANQHRIAILDQSLSLDKLSITPEEAQFLELRQYTRADIASLFRVPAHYVGELGKMTNSNTENMNLSFVVDTLRPYLSRIEAEITKKLLPVTPGQQSTLQVAFDTTERLRGDYLSQMQGAAAGRNGGWFTGNDVLRSLGMNEAGEELDVYLVPQNMMNAKRLLETAQPPAQEGTVSDA